MTTTLRDKRALETMHRQIHDRMQGLPAPSAPKRRKCSTCGKIRPFHSVNAAGHRFCSPACANGYLRSRGFRFRV